MIVWFVDDEINILYQKSIIKERIKEVLNKGFIKDKNEFSERFLALLKKEKIKNKLFGEKITILKQAYYRDSDIYFLESIFTDLGFIKVIFYDIRNILSESATYVEINKEYMIIYLDRAVYLELCYVEDIANMLNNFKNYFNKYIIFYGTNKYIPFIYVKDIQFYYINKYKDFIGNGLLKANKCDV